jgi:hypothetical protein
MCLLSRGLVRRAIMFNIRRWSIRHCLFNLPIRAIASSSLPLIPHRTVITIAHVHGWGLFLSRLNPGDENPQFPIRSFSEFCMKNLWTIVRACYPHWLEVPFFESELAWSWVHARTKVPEIRHRGNTPTRSVHRNGRMGTAQWQSWTTSITPICIQAYTWETGTGRPS